MAFQLRQSQRDLLWKPQTFFWCTGIEDTFITAPWPKTGRTLDEYELTQHYDRWHSDIGLIKEIGADSARYGLPWHRINPARGRWEWEWADRAIDRLLELKIQPIIDLVHYGLPSWIDGAYSHLDFPEFMAEYASRVAGRYQGRVFAYTPLNEPRITAWYCGRIGWWPPFGKSWRSFVMVMKAVAKAIVRTVEALREVDPEIMPVHVDATDLYHAFDPSLLGEATFRQDLVFLALDLISGRVGEAHSLTPWLRKHGFEDGDFAWFSEHRVELPLIGLNLYPMFTYKEVLRNSTGRQRIRMPYAGAELIDQLAALYWERYRSPLFIAETASVGRVARRLRWLDDSLAATQRVRAAGIPLVGYTWWPLFALVTWAYRQGDKPAAAYLRQMGLFNLSDDFERFRTPLVDTFQRYSQQAAVLGANVQAPNIPEKISADLASSRDQRGSQRSAGPDVRS